jgi:large subunit ribosomal protein L17
LTKSLIQHERIITTLPKAKAVRPFVERIITLAKRNSLHARRLVISRLGPASEALVKPVEDDKGPADRRTVVQKLFSDIAPRYAERPGGYTRVIKRHQVRLGDAGATAYLELLKEGTTRSRAKPAYSAPAPAPKVEDQPPTEEAPTPETTGEAPPAEQQQPAPASQQSSSPANG